MLSVRSAHGEIVGDLAVKGSSLKGGVIEGQQIPLVIDELPMLAALGPYTEQGIEIRDAAELRVKESDRIAALAENLRRMGATVEETSGRPARRRPRSREIARRGNRTPTAITACHGLRHSSLGASGATIIRRRRLRRACHIQLFR